MLTLPATSTTMDDAMLAIKETSTRSANPLRMRGTKGNAEKINATSNEFEAQFISQMLSNMFATVEPNEALGGGDAEDVYNSMLVNEYGKVLARTGGVGVADQVKQIMIKQQEVE